MGAIGGWDVVDGLLSAPGGAALLARLEIDQRTDVAPFEVAADSDPDAVARAVRWVAENPFGEVAERIVDAAETIAGPWTSGAPSRVAACVRLACERESIAIEVVRRFDADLNRPSALGAQEWWSSAPQPTSRQNRARFDNFEHVYGSGEYPWAGLWTVTDPPGEAHDALLSAWEIFPGPITRWRLPVRADARVWEIRRPEDWSRLVRTYPTPARHAHGGWALPGPNQHLDDIRGLLAVPGQNAVRVSSKTHLLPDWSAVAADYDGVHLSWAGFVTTEGRICDLEAGTVTMLRFWGSERTLWLADVFGRPEPLPAPRLSGRINDDRGADAFADPSRHAADLATLAAALGR